MERWRAILAIAGIVLLALAAFGVRIGRINMVALAAAVIALAVFLPWIVAL